MLCPSCQALTRPQALSTNLQLARLVEGLAQGAAGPLRGALDPLSIYCEQDRVLVCGVRLARLSPRPPPAAGRRSPRAPQGAGPPGGGWGRDGWLDRSG